MTIADDPPVQAAPIRVLAVNLAGVLAQLVGAVVEQQPDMQFVGRVEQTIPTLLAVKQHAADVVVLGAKEAQPPPRLVRRLLAEFPELKVVVLSGSGDAAMLYWLGVRRRRLGRISRQSLARNIRRAALIDISS